MRVQGNLGNNHDLDEYHNNDIAAMTGSVAQADQIALVDRHVHAPGCCFARLRFCSKPYTVNSISP